MKILNRYSFVQPYLENYHKNEKFLVISKLFSFTMIPENIAKLKDLAQIGISYSDLIINFIIQIPLIKTQIINLYKIITLPIPLDDDYHRTIIQTTPYLIIFEDNFLLMHLRKQKETV